VGSLDGIVGLGVGRAVGEGVGLGVGGGFLVGNGVGLGVGGGGGVVLKFPSSLFRISLNFSFDLCLIVARASIDS